MEAEKPRLDPLLVALQQLRLRGLTAAAVATTFHRRRVMSLCQRRLRLDQMTPEAPLEGSRMSHESLTLEEVKMDEVDKVPMRPTLEFEPLVSVIT
jgi:diphthamide synthase (EF-2-diphthine--ammonia ligase)